MAEPTGKSARYRALDVGESDFPVPEPRARTASGGGDSCILKTRRPIFKGFLRAWRYKSRIDRSPKATPIINFLEDLAAKPRLGKRADSREMRSANPDEPTWRSANEV